MKAPNEKKVSEQAAREDAPDSGQAKPRGAASLDRMVRHVRSGSGKALHNIIHQQD